MKCLSDIRTVWVGASLAVLLAIGCGETPPREGEASAPPPNQEELPPVEDWTCEGCNLVLISIDTLRADHLGVYGYERDTSPNIDRFAGRSILFENAHSTANSTAESHMSMFTSLYPKVHRVLNTRGETGHRLVDGIPTFTEILAQSGYATTGFHGGGNVAGGYGFDRGFDIYRKGSAEDAMAWLQTHRDGPFFLFFHTYHVHDPYTPEPPYDTLYDPDYQGDVISDRAALNEAAGREGFSRLRELYWGPVQGPEDVEHVRALYDGEINEMDEFIGRLLDRIDRLAGEETVVVLTADHGEEFQEHGGFRHDQLYEEILHVPLILHHPKMDGGTRIATPVSLIDLAPTLLDLVGIEAPQPFQGRSLEAVAQGQGEPSPIFAEKVFANAWTSKRGRNSHMTLIQAPMKLILMAEAQLFDLSVDPGEQNPIAGRRSRSSRKMMRELRQIDSDNERISALLNQGGENPVELDEETVERLKALGYL